jgi:two-component system nitrogen regulation response regulator GlnG
VLAATHRDLRKEVREGKFREDLFFRLAVFEIHLPALRDRADDVPLLAEHFLRKLCPSADRIRFAEATIDELRRRPWPGNVRELRNAVEHAALVARSGAIYPEQLPPTVEPITESGLATGATLRSAVRNWALARFASSSRGDLYQQFLDEAEPALLEAVLEQTGNNRVAAANLLGIHRATLRKKLG